MKPVSNSFDYVPAKRLEGFRLRSNDCSAVELGLAGASTSRVVIGRFGSDFLLLRTGTTDFDSDTIREVVHRRGQLYLDVSRRTHVEDFASDVVQMTLSTECLECSHLATCCACFEPTSQARFLSDEDWTRRKLAEMRGRVLDVGMGNLPYRETIVSLLERGDVEYVGVEPDERAAAWAASLGPRVRVLGCSIEEAELPTDSFDWVIAIRSLNHFQDVERALSVMFDAARDGATMLLIESLPLPLVRGRRHARLSHELAPRGFEHYRNWGSEDFLEFAGSRYAFEVLYHRPVGRDTCDQWLLVLEVRKGGLSLDGPGYQPSP